MKWHKRIVDLANEELLRIAQFSSQWDLTLLEQLLSLGADPLCEGPHSGSPFYYAVVNLRSEAVRFFLEKGYKYPEEDLKGVREWPKQHEFFDRDEKAQEVYNLLLGNRDALPNQNFDESLMSKINGFLTENTITKITHPKLTQLLADQWDFMTRNNFNWDPLLAEELYSVATPGQRIIDLALDYANPKMVKFLLEKGMMPSQHQIEDCLSWRETMGPEDQMQNNVKETYAIVQSLLKGSMTRTNFDESMNIYSSIDQFLEGVSEKPAEITPPAAPEVPVSNDIPFGSLGIGDPFYLSGASSERIYVKATPNEAEMLDSNDRLSFTQDELITPCDVTQKISSELEQ